MTKVIFCSTPEEMKECMEPFMYSPDKTSVWLLNPIRANCGCCGKFQLAPRSECDLDGGFVCVACGAFNKMKVVPDAGQPYMLTPIEIRTIYFN